LYSQDTGVKILTNRDATSVRQDETPTIENYMDIVSLVDKAIENEDTSVIEEIEDKNHLKYMQKDAEVRLLRNDSIVSSLSLGIGIKAIFLCIAAIGLSFFLVGIPIGGLPKIAYFIGGFFIILLGVMGSVWWDRKYKKELEKRDKAIEFMCTLILKIEEKLLK